MSCDAYHMHCHFLIVTICYVFVCVCVYVYMRVCVCNGVEAHNIMQHFQRVIQKIFNYLRFLVCMCA